MSRLRAAVQRRHEGHGDAGLGLVEVLMTTVLTAVLGTVLMTAVQGSHEVFRRADAESRGQTDVRTTIERLGRDVRNARSLDPGATASQLVLWIDADSDYVKDTAEVVSWTLVPGVDGHFDVARTQGGTTVRTARFVISQLAFSYRVDAAGAPLVPPLTAAQAATVRVVSSDVLYAVEADRAGAARHAVFTERMRNVA